MADGRWPTALNSCPVRDGQHRDLGRGLGAAAAAHRDRRRAGRSADFVGRAEAADMQGPCNSGVSDVFHSIAYVIRPLVYT